jgi:hypothetical protein
MVMMMIMRVMMMMMMMMVSILFALTTITKISGALASDPDIHAMLKLDDSEALLVTFPY